MKKLKLNKNFWVKFFLPATAGMGMIVGLTIGIPLAIRAKHVVPTNLTLRLEAPNFKNKNPADSSFAFNSKTYDKNAYIKYSIVKDKKQVSQMVPYDLEYMKTYNASSVNNNIKTMGDFVNKWNNENNNELFKVKSFGTLGSFVSSFKNKHPIGKNDLYLPSSSQTKSYSIAITSSTNSITKNKKAQAGIGIPYSLPNETSVGIDSMYMQNNDVFNLINWPWK